MKRELMSESNDDLQDFDAYADVLFSQSPKLKSNQYRILYDNNIIRCVI